MDPADFAAGRDEAVLVAVGRAVARFAADDFAAAPAADRLVDLLPVPTERVALGLAAVARVPVAGFAADTPLFAVVVRLPVGLATVVRVPVTVPAARVPVGLATVVRVPVTVPAARVPVGLAVDDRVLADVAAVGRPAVLTLVADFAVAGRVA